MGVGDPPLTRTGLPEAEDRKSSPQSACPGTTMMGFCLEIHLSLTPLSRGQDHPPSWVLGGEHLSGDSAGHPEVPVVGWTGRLWTGSQRVRGLSQQQGLPDKETLHKEGAHLSQGSSDTLPTSATLPCPRAPAPHHHHTLILPPSCAAVGLPYLHA